MAPPTPGSSQPLELPLEDVSNLPISVGRRQMAPSPDVKLVGNMMSLGLPYKIALMEYHRRQNNIYFSRGSALNKKPH